jgi:uncharacterized membrane protein
MNAVHVIENISIAFELAGVAIIVIGAVYAFALFVIAIIRHEGGITRYRAFRQNLGRAILIGLEVLVAADIIRTVAIDPSFASVGVLGLLVLVRTFLSWSLEVEIRGAWPWQQARSPEDEEVHATPSSEASASVTEGALQGSLPAAPGMDSFAPGHPPTAPRRDQ